MEMPLCREAVGLALAELHQHAGDLAAAIAALEALPPSGPVGISAAELYCAAGRYREVVEMTEGVENDDDASAFLLVMRGVALHEMGHLDAAKNCFTEALRPRSRAVEIRHRALIERAQVHLDKRRNGMAKGPGAHSCRRLCLSWPGGSPEPDPGMTRASVGSDCPRLHAGLHDQPSNRTQMSITSPRVTDPQGSPSLARDRNSGLQVPAL
ncbi:MAG: hypothetical protein IPJ14_17365 [Kineosporiaceae bacterium]|nr:hypothetical protein [Kineosporiaceae bacterium]